MGTAIAQYKNELMQEIEGMPSRKLKEILDFVCFIKAREAIDPSQSYFWTQKWQEMERKADKDKKMKKTIGDGTLSSMLNELDA